MTEREQARQYILSIKSIRQGRVKLKDSIAGYKTGKKYFALLLLNDEDKKYVLYTGSNKKISIQDIHFSCSADVDYMLTQIAIQMAKRNYTELHGLGFSRWPSIYV